MKLTRLILVAAASLTVFAQTRFDLAVRNDLLAGMTGDMKSLERGLATCEKILSENPKDAEALEWHGIGTLILSRFEAQKGNAEGALSLVQKGIAEMDRAVEMEPTNLSVRIPRGAAYRDATREMPPFMADPLLEKARIDFQYTFDLQKDRLPTGEHPLGELLQALGDIYSRQGKLDDAGKYYGLLQDRLPSTEYGKTRGGVAEDPSDPAGRTIGMPRVPRQVRPFSWRDFIGFLGFCFAVETCMAALTVLPNGWFGWEHFLVNYAIGFTFVFEIGALAWLVTPAIAHRVWAWPMFPRWSAIVAVLFVSAVVGTWLSTGLLQIFGVETQFSYALSIAVPVTLIAGVTITLLESRKAQLRSTENALSAQRIERERAEKLAAEAQLASLTSRVQPHFLFNTLNSISALIRENPQQAEQMLQQLSSLLRGSLDTAQIIPLESEWKLVRDYLEIQRVRLGDRLRYEVDWQAAAMNGITVPPFSVQTLVENSVKHVAGQRQEGLVLRLSARRTEAELVVEVTDDGPGFTPDAVTAGHGLDNLQKRLRALYGERAGLEFDRSARGMTVRMRVPVA